MWNSVGIVRQYVSEDENSIDVEFHDTTTHHALHIDNKSDYVMSALSKQAVLFASREEDDTPRLVFKLIFYLKSLLTSKVCNQHFYQGLLSRFLFF